MALDTLLHSNHAVLTVVVLSIALLTSVYYYAFARPPLPKGTPTYATESWPILGATQFFTQRWSFFQHQVAHSQTSNFSFHVGKKLVIAVSGPESRRIFYESKQLGFGEGYGPLLGGGPTAELKKGSKLLGESVTDDREFSEYFSRRLLAIVKGPMLARGLSKLLADTRARLDELVAQKEQVTNPFESIYRIVFQLTMRTVACSEIADDAVMREKVLHYFELIGTSAAPLNIMYNWFPTPTKISRIYNGSKLYAIFKKIMDARREENRREDDALQYLIDQGDDITKIITFVLGAVFAGQLNSGINAAYVLIYLSSNPEWFSRVRNEVETVASRYNNDISLPIRDRLMSVPYFAWESEFPMIDLCLRDSIRLSRSSVSFRRNISEAAIPLNKEGTEVIPPGAFVIYAPGDTHFNPAIYDNPDEWNPSRYLPERAEDKREPYAFNGWGLGRHPCLGMRFAKLEMNILIGLAIAYFDKLELVDASGNATGLPSVNRESYLAHKPDVEVFLKYTVRKD